MNIPLLAWMPGPIEWVLIAAVALVIFGRRLPEVARSMGKSIVEFKKGLRDVKGEIDSAATGSGERSLPGDREAADPRKRNGEA